METIEKPYQHALDPQKWLVGRDVEHLKSTLSKDGVVCIDDFIPEHSIKELASEVDSLVANYGRNVNVHIESTGNTPRKYRSVSRDDVFAHAPLISRMYLDESLLSFIRMLADDTVIPCPYEPEQIVVNKMSSVGDTHGWHWDDYSYSLVIVLEAPCPANGAQVEFVDGTSWDKKSPKVSHYLSTRQTQSLKLSRGSIYILLGKRVMHRVSPLLSDDTRKIICFSYATEEERNLKVDHGSMENIYG